MPNSQTREEPRWMRVARAVYKDQFEGKTRDEVIEAMDEWGEDGEELFILAHLGYLNVRASRDLLFAHHDLLDGIAQVIEEQRKTRELLVKLGRFLKRELGALTELLDEDIDAEEDELAGDDDEEDTPEPAEAPSPAPSSPSKPELLDHPVPEDDQ